jgi:hypothetical protein
MRPSTLKWVLLLPLALDLATPVQAQTGLPPYSRTWISGVGDDGNPCWRTAPCKTCAGAISKTTPAGEIDALDPGGFGGVTITKAITVDGGAGLAGILVAGTNGITIHAGATDVVILRHLDIVGLGTGLAGIQIAQAGLVLVEHCNISGFAGAGIEVTAAPGSVCALVVNDVHITGLSGIGTNTGVKIDATATGCTGTLDQVVIHGTGASAIDVAAGALTVNRSAITLNAGVGVLAEGGTVTVVNSTLSHNGTAAFNGLSGTLRAANDDVYDNGAAFLGAGTMVSGGNNRLAGNVNAGVNPGTTIPVL